jgi:phage N-6-adenine-methyltransferase
MAPVPVTQPFWTSASDEWATPQKLVEAAAARLGVLDFALDAAATPENAKAPRFYTREDSGLLHPWLNPTWCNPPYSIVAYFAKHAAEQARNGVRVALLVPARTDTRWWHKHVMPRALSLHFVVGRVTFGGGKSCAPFPSVVAMLGAGACGAPRCHALEVS